MEDHGKKHGQSPHGMMYDLEGPIVRLDRLHEIAAERAARDLGWTDHFDFLLLTERSGVNNVIGGGDNVVMSAVLKVLEIPQDKLAVEAAVRRKQAYYTEDFEALGTRMTEYLVPGFVDTVRELNALGIPVGICSLTPDEYARKIITWCGIDKLIPPRHWVTLGSVGKDPVNGEVLKKSAPRGAGFCWWELAVRFTHAAGHEIRPYQTMVAGDSPADVYSWRDCGVPLRNMIGIPQIPQVGPLLVKAGLPEDRIFEDWTLTGVVEDFRQALS